MDGCCWKGFFQSYPLRIFHRAQRNSGEGFGVKGEKDPASVIQRLARTESPSSWVYRDRVRAVHNLVAN